jgi:Protein of unknown function (DUF3182)
MKTVVRLDNPVLEYAPNSSVPVSIDAVAERIATHIGAVMDTSETAATERYFVPMAAIHEPLARKVGISALGGAYGGIVKELQHADKAVLHQLPHASMQSPGWYSRRFATEVKDTVLPGFTTFSAEDTRVAFNRMQGEGYSVRFKDPAGTGEKGQYLVKTRDELEQVMLRHGDGFTEAGAILEANLNNAETITVGYVDIEGDQYSWYGSPYDVEFSGTKRFGGNDITVVRGGLSALRDYCKDVRNKTAVEQSKVVFDAYHAHLGSLIMRATFDAVQGIDNNGQFISGITDPSLRPSASSAAEIRAIEAFRDYPDAKAVKTRIVYDYAKELSINDKSQRELFVQHDRMNMFVEVIEIEK